MDLKRVFIVTTCVLAWSGMAAAAEPYRGDQLLNLDLSQAVLSPQPIGPPNQFTPGPLDVHVAREDAPPRASVVTGGTPESAMPAAIIHRTRVAHARAEKPRGAARIRLAHRHGNPLDAQAFDTRIQVWPCRSGGICGWKR